MDLIREIRNHFVAIEHDTAIAISLPDEYEAWVVRFGEKIGVAIPCVLKEAFYEYFASLQIEYLPHAHIEGTAKELLVLYVEDSEMFPREMALEFAAICADFVSPGEKGENRKFITSTPVEWWKKWKELVGNRNADLAVHALFGELFFYRWLLEHGKNAQWTGCQYKKVDFICDKDRYEVKSTLSAYSNDVIVHGQFQLLIEEDKPLYLVFCRLEERKGGMSVDQLIDDLVKMKGDRTFLEKEIDKLGYKKGMNDRKRTFKILEMKLFNVDNKFPRIVSKSFKNNKIPDGVIRIEYSVDLSNLEYTVLC